MQMTDVIPVSIALSINSVLNVYMFGVLCLAILVVLTYEARYQFLMVFSISLLFTASTVWILKHTFAVPRPGNALIQLSDYAFPSGHATLSMFLASFLSLLILATTKLTKQYRVLLLILLFGSALYISLSRIILHVHTPVQVIVGTGIGIITPIVFDVAAKKYFNI